MAKYRNIQTKFWTDPFIVSLTPEQKFFYIYLLTNPLSKQCGIYELTIRQAAFDTGYNQETVEKLITIFEDHGKIKYSKSTSEICLINFLKHNATKSPKVQKCIENELKEVKDRVLIGYIYPMDRGAQEKEEEKEEKEEEKGETPSLKSLYDSFNSFYEKYEGIKRNFETEFRFLKNNFPNEWKEIVPKLTPSIENQLLDAANKRKNSQFVPYSKTMKNWIKERCWENQIAIKSISSKPKWADPSRKVL